MWQMKLEMSRERGQLGKGLRTKLRIWAFKAKGGRGYVIRASLIYSVISLFL